MRSSALLGIIFGSLVASPAAIHGSQERVERALRDYESVRGRLEAAVNERRAESGLAPLAGDPALTRAAQEGALAIAARLEAGGQLAEALSDDELDGWLARAGYEPHEFAAEVAVSDGQPREVAAWLMATGRIQLRRPDLSDLGIGIAPSWRSRIYLVIVARSAADHFAAETSALGSPTEVRARLLARTNDARLEAGRGRLEPDACLERVAQAYAERMLAEGFFSHTAPEGQEVAERARAGGCPHRPVGENLAWGPTSVDEVVAEWTASEDHRRVLLEERFDRIGVGLAMGRRAEDYGVLWVQVLGASAGRSGG